MNGVIGAVFKHPCGQVEELEGDGEVRRGLSGIILVVHVGSLGD